MRWNKRTDRNHKQIIDTFRQLGWDVIDTHEVGKGFPDCMINRGGRSGPVFLIEIKDGEKKTYQWRWTAKQLELSSRWPIHVVTTVEEAIKLSEVLCSR